MKTAEVSVAYRTIMTTDYQMYRSVPNNDTNLQQFLATLQTWRKRQEEVSHGRADAAPSEADQLLSAEELQMSQRALLSFLNSLPALWQWGQQRMVGIRQRELPLWFRRIVAQ